MRLIKNFLHNINDIVLAIAIVALAAGIIYWRMQIILDYPKQLADQQAVHMEEADEDAAVTEEAEAQGEAAAEQTDTEQPADSAETPAENAESEEQPQG